jgi:hypothetical protein
VPGGFLAGEVGGRPCKLNSCAVRPVRLWAGLTGVPGLRADCDLTGLVFDSARSVLTATSKENNTGDLSLGQFHRPERIHSAPTKPNVKRQQEGKGQTNGDV